MIEYKFAEEKVIALHYANLLSNQKAKEILEKGFVDDSVEAIALKNFYWSMVDEVVIDRGKGLKLLEGDNIDFWMEYIFHSFNGYLVSNGYSQEWDIE